MNRESFTALKYPLFQLKFDYLFSMHFLYIMYSPSTDKYFTGETNNVPKRVELHNKPRDIKALTRAASDWEVKLIFKCNSREEATYLVKKINDLKSRKFLEEVIDQPQLLSDLLKSRR